MATTTQPKLTVWAPRVPGVDPSIVGVCDTIADARQIAAGFRRRTDLAYQDVFIRLGEDGKIIERCGPAR